MREISDLNFCFGFIILFSHRTAVACGSIGFLEWLSPAVLRWCLLFKGDRHTNKKIKWREEGAVAFPIPCLWRDFPGICITNQAFGKHALLLGSFTLPFSVVSWIVQERWQASLLTSNSSLGIFASYKGYIGEVLSQRFG